MYKKELVIVSCLVILLIIFSTSSGCLKPLSDEKGYASIPEMIVDYDFEDERFEIYLKSAVGDYKFEHLIIEVNGNRSMENNTYALCSTCIDRELELDCEAQVDEDTIYYYACDIEIIDDDDEDIFILITERVTEDEKEDEVSKEDMPWKKILERKK